MRIVGRRGEFIDTDILDKRGSKAVVHTTTSFFPRCCTCCWPCHVSNGVLPLSISNTASLNMSKSRMTILLSRCGRKGEQRIDIQNTISTAWFCFFMSALSCITQRVLVVSFCSFLAQPTITYRVEATRSSLLLQRDRSNTC